jgi:hypothetical protein
MKGWKIFVLAILLYGVSVFGGFVQDDVFVVSTNPKMGDIQSLFSVWFEPYYYGGTAGIGLYRPLTSFSIYLNGFLTGYEPWGFHLVNILLYAGVCWLVFEVLKKYVKEKYAFWTSIIFVVLPIHSEVVNSIVGRAEILSLGFTLVSLLYFLDKKWLMVCVALFCSLLAKETGVVGMALILYLTVIEKIDIKKKIVFIMALVLIIVGYIFLRFWVVGSLMGVEYIPYRDNPLSILEFGERIKNALALIPFGVGKVLFPVQLSSDYSFNQLKLVERWFDWKVVLGVLMMIVSIGSLFTKMRKNKLWILGQAFFWGPVLITGNILFPIGTIFGERLWFWPSLGMILILTQLLRSCRLHTFSGQTEYSPCVGISCCAVRMVVSRRHHAIRTLRSPAEKGIVYVALLIVALFAGRTFVRNLDWHSNESLSIADSRYAIDSVKVQVNAAKAYINLNNPEKAKKALEAAEKIDHSYPYLESRWREYYLLIEKNKAK